MAGHLSVPSYFASPNSIAAGQEISLPLQLALDFLKKKEMFGISHQDLVVIQNRLTYPLTEQTNLSLSIHK